MTPRWLARGWVLSVALLAVSGAASAQNGQSCVPDTAGASANSASKSLPTSPEISRLIFVGNGVHSDFTDAQLARFVRTTPSSISRRIALSWFSISVPPFRWLAPLLGPKHCLNRKEVATDAQNLARYYQESGYPGTTVGTRITRSRGGRTDVSFLIDEAPPVNIDSVSVRWETVPPGIDTAALRRRLYSAVGLPYNLPRTTADADTLEQELRNSGYPDGAALYRDTLRMGERRASIWFDIYPGRFVRVGKVTIDATNKNGGDTLAINPKWVRPLLGLKTGDRYDESAVLDALRRAYELGTYVSVSPDTAREPGDSVMDETLHLREGDMHQLSTEYGWATLDCGRASAHVTDRAVLQTTNRLELNAAASKIGWGRPWESDFTRENLCGFQGNALANDSLGSSKLNYNLTATLTQPGSFNGRGVPSVSVYSEVRSGYQAFLRETKIGSAASITLPRPALTTLASYDLEYGHTDAEPAVLCFVFQACDEATRQQLTGGDRLLAVLGVRATRERYDDPVLRSSGTSLSLEVRTSNHLLGSDPTLTFTKGSIDASWYHPFLNDGRNTLSVRFRAGVVYGGTGDRLPPPQERLYGGGPNSLRGVQQNELGPVIYAIDRVRIDTTAAGIDTVASDQPQRVIPVGGNSLVVANFDYRLRSPVLSDVLQVVVFTDVGQVWTRGVDKQVNYRVTPGIGLRFLAGFLGALQLNVAYNGYDQPAGPAYLNQGISGGPAPLICVSPKDPTSNSPCPSTYVPARSKTFFQRYLVVTFGIGT